MNTALSDIERERLLERIVRAAAAVVDEADWMDMAGVATALAELEAALEALPRAERVRYGG